MEKLYKPKEIAEVLGMSVASVYIWIQRGYIKPVHLPTGKLRISEAELKRMLSDEREE